MKKITNARPQIHSFEDKKPQGLRFSNSKPSSLKQKDAKPISLLLQDKKPHNLNLIKPNFTYIETRTILKGQPIPWGLNWLITYPATLVFEGVRL